MLQIWSRIQQLDLEKKDKEAFDMWTSDLAPAAKVQIKAINDLTDFNKRRRRQFRCSHKFGLYGSLAGLVDDGYRRW
jgi:hypothetical protein